MGKRVLFCLIILSFILFLIINFKSPIKIQSDGVFYYSWLHSFLFDRDFNFYNEMKHYSSYDFYSNYFIKNNILSPTGRIPNPYAYGSALMWLPLISVAHLLTLFFNKFNPNFFIPDGYSYFYNLSINFSSWFFGTLALLIIYRINRIINYSALKASLAIFLATPWVYYQFWEPSMSHITSLFLVTYWWYLVIKMWQQKKMNILLFILVTFLMVATRWQNLIFCLVYLPLAWQNKGEIKIFIKKIIILLLPILLFWASQFLIWKYLYGKYILVPQGHHFVRFEFHGLYTLFSSNRGLFLWSPILILAVVGWFYLFKKSKYLAWATLIIFIGQWLINSSLSDLGGGDAFGGRRFIETFPFLAICLAALFERFKKYNWQTWTLIVLFIFSNFLLIENYRLGVLPHSGKFNFLKIDYLETIKKTIN